MVELLEGGEEWLVLVEFGGGSDFGGGGDAERDDLVEGIEGRGGAADEEVEFAGFLEGEDGEVAGAEEGGFVVDEDELGVDHGVGEVNGDGGLGEDFMKGAVVEVVADVGLSGREEGRQRGNTWCGYG